MKLSIHVHIRISANQDRLLDLLVKKEIFRSRTRAIETFIQEGLEKRDLINYKEVLSDE